MSNYRSDPTFEKEWAKRIVAVSKNLRQGGLVADEQRDIRTMAAHLKIARKEQDLRLDDVASVLEIDPLILYLFEAGLILREECLEIADRWAYCVNVDVSEFLDQLKHGMSASNGDESDEW